MQFVEMLEFLARIANIVYKTADSMPLYQKIDKILDSVLSLASLKRKPPNIIDFIYSESDDD